MYCCASPLHLCLESSSLYSSANMFLLFAAEMDMFANMVVDAMNAVKRVSPSVCLGDLWCVSTMSDGVVCLLRRVM